MNAPTIVGRGSSSLAQRFWRVWLWAAFLLPTLFVVLFPDGYVKFLVVAPLSVFIVPVVGLLGILPRWVLRRRGHTAVPMPVVVLLVLHWWSCVLLVFSLDSEGDFSAPSLLSVISGGLVPSLLMRWISAVMILVGIATGIAILLLSIIVKPRPTDARRMRTAVLTAGIVPLALLVAASLLTPVVVGGMQDAAGDSVREVKARPFEDQVRIFEQRYDSQQAELSEVRLLVGDDVPWSVMSYGLDWNMSGETYGVGSYRFELVYAIDRHLTDAESQAILDHLEAQGWQSELGAYGLYGEHEDGRKLTLTHQSPGHSTLEYTSPAWWGDGSSLIDEVRGEPVEDDASYAADEWPRY